MLLVVLVVVVFLQTWRASVVPLVAVPIAIVGAMAVLLLLGFSINSLSLFGLVLATGIVVDDAIVVVENVERKIEEGLPPREAAHAAMAEVTRPIISIMLVLCSVFVPVAFLSGITGQFYRQFAITIAASTIISTFNSLTLSPALAALLLRPRHEKPDAFQRLIDRVLGLPFKAFNRLFGRLSKDYGKAVSVVARRRNPILLAFVILLGCTWFIFRIVPSGFIPSQDKQYLIGVVQLPNAASLDRTEKVVRQMSQIALATPGVEHVIGFPGLSANGFVNLDNSAVVFLPLTDFDKRTTKDLSGRALAGTLMQEILGHRRCQHSRDPAASRTGTGNHGRLQVVSAGPRRPRLRRPCQGNRRHPEFRATAEGAVRTRHLHDLPEWRAAAVRGRRSRQGEAPGHSAVEHLQHPAGLPGLDLRQRLQQIRPYIPRLRPGRGPVPGASGRCREPEDPQRQR